MHSVRIFGADAAFTTVIRIKKEDLSHRLPLLDAVDFVELLRCHWVSDTNTFPQERQRIQLATILLVAAFTGSRPGAILGITYRDLDLFVQRDKTTGEVALSPEHTSSTRSSLSKNRCISYRPTTQDSRRKAYSNAGSEKRSP